MKVLPIAEAMFFRRGNYDMNKTETKTQIKQLQHQLKAVNKANDYRLLKLVLLLVIVAFLAAIICGRIVI